MTLKSYTDFVVKFALVAYSTTPALATGREKEKMRTLLLDELAPLISPENWEKLVDIFMKKVKFPEGFDKHKHFALYILWNRSEFTETLAELCEPLIERTAEKPEGGQDAAKS